VGVVFGLCAAIFWGLGDFLITHLTRRVGTSIALVTIQVFSLLGWVMWVTARPSTPTASLALWGIVVATAICHVLGLVFVYRAFQVGTLSIVSPISAGFAVVTAVLALSTGERPPLTAMGGAGLLLLGVVLATRAPSDPQAPRPSLIGVPEAILSALAFGTMFWLFSFFVEPRMGYGWPLVLLKTMAVSSSLLALMAQRRQEKKSLRITLGLGAVLLALGAALADTLAWLTYIWGSATGYATVVTALASLFSVITVLLAWRFLRERLAPHQWAGVGVILVGILFVSI
jgi:drug/metabolite transporter (DMT)-like permease